nr:MAG TPA: Rhomboid family [Caudoviricetes sp.]
MDRRKIEKITSLLIAVIIVSLSIFCKFDWKDVGIYSGCNLQCRLLYPFFHANVLHAVLNAWCFISIIFIYDVSIWRIFIAYLVAVFIPIDTIDSLIGGYSSPTVGLSGVIFFLFGSISFEVLRKWYYQMWMLFYIIIGFIFPNTNAWIHLFCYCVGFLFSLLNKPIKI